MGNDGPTNVLYQMSLMRQRGEKIDPNNLPGNTPDNKLYIAKPGVVKHLKKASTPKEPISHFTEDQNKLADELIEWCKTTEMVNGVSRPRIDLREFFHERNLSFWEFKKKADLNDYMKSKLALAGEMVGCNARKNWAWNAGNSQGMHSLLREFDNGYKEAEVEEAAIKKQIENKDIKVLIQTAPATGKSKRIPSNQLSTKVKSFLTPNLEGR